MRRMISRMGLIALIAVFLVGVFMPMQAAAADSIFCKSMTGTTTGATIGFGYTYGAYVAIAGDNNSQVVVTSLSGTADNAATTCNAYIYDKENEATVNSSSSSGGQEIGIASGGASIDASDIIVLQNPAGDVVYVETVASTGATTIAIAGVLDGAITSGWKVYEMEKIAEVPVGNATKSYESDVAVVAGTKDSPVLIFLGGVASCSINFASGHYK